MLQREIARRVTAVKKLKAQRISLEELDALLDSLQHRALPRRIIGLYFGSISVRNNRAIVLTEFGISNACKPLIAQ